MAFPLEPVELEDTEELREAGKRATSDNQLLKIERATSVNFILQHVSSDSQSLLDQLIKQQRMYKEYGERHLPDLPVE